MKNIINVNILLMVLSVVWTVACTKEENHDTPAATDTTDNYEPWLETNDVKVASVYQSHWEAPYWDYFTNGQGDPDSIWIESSYSYMTMEYEWEGDRLLSISSNGCIGGYMYEDRESYNYVYENNRLTKIVLSQSPEWYVKIKYNGNKISEVDKYHNNDLYKKLQFEYEGNWPTRIICNSDGSVYTYNLGNDGKNITSFSYDLDGEHISYGLVYDDKVNPLKGVIMFTPMDYSDVISIFDFPLGALSMLEGNSMISPFNSNNFIRYTDDDYNRYYQYEGNFPHRVTWGDESQRDTVIFEYSRAVVSK